MLNSGGVTCCNTWGKSRMHDDGIMSGDAC